MITGRFGVVVAPKCVWYNILCLKMNPKWKNAAGNRMKNNLEVFTEWGWNRWWHGQREQYSMFLQYNMSSCGRKGLDSFSSSTAWIKLPHFRWGVRLTSCLSEVWCTWKLSPRSLRVSGQMRSLSVWISIIKTAAGYLFVLVCCSLSILAVRFGRNTWAHFWYLFGFIPYGIIVFYTLLPNVLHKLLKYNTLLYLSGKGQFCNNVWCVWAVNSFSSSELWIKLLNTSGIFACERKMKIEYLRFTDLWHLVYFMNELISTLCTCCKKAHGTLYIICYATD